MNNCLQNALELKFAPGQEINVCAGEISLKCAVCGTSGKKSLVHGGVVGVPVEPVLAVKLIRASRENLKALDLHKVVVRGGFVSVGAEESIHHLNRGVGVVVGLSWLKRLGWIFDEDEKVGAWGYLWEDDTKKLKKKFKWRQANAPHFPRIEPI